MVVPGTKFNVGAVGAPTSESPDLRESGKPFYVIVGLFSGAGASTIYYESKSEAEAEATRLATAKIGHKFGVAEIQSIAQTPAAVIVALK